MFVAFSAWLLRVLCVYTYDEANYVPIRLGLTKSPLPAKKSIFDDKMTLFGRISGDLLVYVINFLYLCAKIAQVGTNEELY